MNNQVKYCLHYINVLLFTVNTSKFASNWQVLALSHAITTDKPASKNVRRFVIPHCNYKPFGQSDPRQLRTMSYKFQIDQTSSSYRN